MSQAGNFFTTGDFPPGTVVETLTGNTGGAVGPNGANNINVIGDGVGITVAGSPGTNTLTISLVGGGGTTDQFDTDNGTALPIAGVINIITDNADIQAGSSVFFSGSSNTVLLTVTDSNNNTIIGEDSGNLTLSGSANTVLGKQSAPSLTIGSDNTVIGAFSAPFLDSGEDNVIIGSSAAGSLNSGEDNVIIGADSAGALDGGDQNVIIGGNAAASVNSGNQNVLIGYLVASTLDGGTNNVIIGRSAASSIAGGSFNVMVGDNTGDGFDGNDDSNICIGYNIPGASGQTNSLTIGKTTGSGDGELNKSFIHGIRGITPANPDGLPVIIDSAGQLGTGGSTIATQFDGDTGSALPVAGILNIITNTATQNSGSSVSFIGSGNTIQLDVTDADLNTIVGKGSGNATLTGVRNTVFGSSSGVAITDGEDNTIIGEDTGSLLTGGSNNTFIGHGAAVSATDASSNVLIGEHCTRFLTNGGFNVIVGCEAGNALTTTEATNIIIGANVTGVVGLSNRLQIGSATGTANGEINKSFIHGIRGITPATNDGIPVYINSLGQLGTVGTSTLSYTNVNTTPYVVLSTDNYLSVDSSGGVITIQLPNAATLGKTYVVKDRTGSAGTNAITVTTVGGAVNIDGATTFVMNTNYQAISIIGNGSTYEIY